MDKIKSIGSIFEIDRSQISKQTKPDASKAKKHTASSAKKKAKKLSSNELKQSISKKLKTLDKNSENYKQQSNIVFLESVLLWEFGEEIINDPKFQQMVSKINTAISQDKKTSDNFSLLIKQLTS